MFGTYTTDELQRLVCLLLSPGFDPSNDIKRAKA